jgi:FkbH-like protein
MTTFSGDLDDILERYHGLVVSDPRLAYSSVSDWLKAALRDLRWSELGRVLPGLIVPELDYTSATRLHRIARQAVAGSPGHGRPMRLAVLGGFTTHQLVDLVDLFLLGAGVHAETYEGEYGTFRQAILDPGSEIYEFKPECLYVATSWRDLGHLPQLSDDRASVQRKIDAELGDWLALWRTAYDRLGCQIIQNNFEHPPWQALGNHERRYPAGFGRFVTLFNQALEDAAPPYVTIHDVDHLASVWGRWTWSDERFYFQAKLPCSPECLVDYAHSVASLIVAQLGLGKKCLVLDLDNTIWGGVIGDDGIGGIRLGQGGPEGEAYLAFQRYVKDLRRRGVLLAVCSKNTDQIAREVFEKHPEMVLRLEDVACFVANWEDKVSNLRTIAVRLNIGLDSLVFVDDNPAERAIVRRLVPEVAAPELPDDPAGYIQALERRRYFQPVTISSEDLRRTDFYQVDEARRAAESSAMDLNGFLKSLEMVARVGPIDAATLERSVQLIHRSNQFNLTTRRHGSAEILRMMEDERWLTRTVSLRDRFSENGLISVVLARVQEDALEIDTWLMSCRVLRRGVEQFLLNHLYEQALGRGLSVLRGEYHPTAKNGLVRDHYRDLGFTLVGEDGEGRTRWELAVGEGRQPLETFILGEPV